MKLGQLLRNVDILEQTASPELEIKNVRYASNLVEAGDLFVAVPGYVTDGHRFISDAIRRGAAAVVCQEQMPEGTPWVRVASSRAALARLGANRFDEPSKSMCVIGVTGTNGKTTVTYLLKTLLENALGARVGLIGTICNQIGKQTLPSEHTTPESYDLQALLAQMRDAGCTHVVMEVSSHALYLHRVDCIDFAVGAFTNLTQDHLDFHKTMDAYCAAKQMLFTRCRKGVFNTDDRYAQQMMRGATCSRYTVGETGTPELLAKNIELCPDHVEADICEKDDRVHLRLGIPGRFTVHNALTALGIARQLAIPLRGAVDALSRAKGVKGRVEVVPTPDREFTVLIDYAHTPDGLENVLRSVRDFCKGRLIVLFGCGGDRDHGKRPKMGRIAAELADLVIVTSDNPRTEEPMAIIRDILSGMEGTKTPYLVEENRRAAIRIALRNAQKDDMIVLAGKGHETYQILGTQKTHLDEREEVAAALCEISH